MFSTPLPASRSDLSLAPKRGDVDRISVHLRAHGGRCAGTTLALFGAQGQHVGAWGATRLAVFRKLGCAFALGDAPPEDPRGPGCMGIAAATACRARRGGAAHELAGEESRWLSR